MSAPSLLGDDFRAWFEARLVTLHEWAADIIKAGRRVQPAIAVFHGESLALMPLRFEDVDDKNVVARLHRTLGSFADGGAIMITEAWTLATDASDTAARARHDREGIANEPDRKEAVFWSALRGKRQLIATAEIERPGNTLGPVKIIDPSRELFTGRFVHERRKPH